MTWNLEEAMEYYRQQGAPGEQSAILGLLREIQQESGGSIPRGIPARVAETYGIRESLVMALIRRIPSLRMSDSHSLEICAGPNCGKCKALAAAAEKCRSKTVAVKFVPCMRMCGKGPNLRWDGTLYHRATEDLLKKLLEEA